MTPPPISPAEWLASLPPEEREAHLRDVSAAVKGELGYHWPYWARPNQLAPPGEWFVWLVLAGRGWGKTRCGAEWVRSEIEAERRGKLALIAPTAADLRDVMIEHGAASIMKNARHNFRPVYEPSKRRLTWPNGATATLFSAEEPERLRGGGWDGGWCDELAAWERAQETWDLFMFTLRERGQGGAPRIVVTTTPKPIPLIKALIAEPGCIVTRGSTFENQHLDPDFLKRIVARFGGTRLGRQELNAELLEDTPGALWTRALIEQARVREAPPMSRVVVAIDPAVTAEEDSDETGIIVVGMGMDGQGYVLEDCSLKASPHGWASVAVMAYKAWKADRIVAEVNNGGDMVEYTLRTIEPMIPYTKLHASRGKQTRAEPVAALYEKGRVHHVGAFEKLEDQLCDWTPGMDSPDRLDALVWACTELLLDGRAHGDFGISVGVGSSAQRLGPKPFAEQNADAFLGRTNGHTNGRGNGFS